MLDLAKIYGTYEGLTFYGDHEHDDVVYYLPDEVRLCKDTESHYEMNLLVWREGDFVSSDKVDLEKTVGSVLQMGVCCSVEQDRLNKALKELKKKLVLPDELKVTQPLWKDGKVDLMVLDRQRSVVNEEEEGDDDRFIKDILGSLKPSLMSNDLKCIFNVVSDKKGTELLYSALKGGNSSLAGVMYDLQFPAMTQAADIRISANLSKCQETLSHDLDAGFTYQGEVGVSLGAAFEKLTQKMEDEGGIQIEYFSMVDSDAEKKRIDELVADFKEQVLEQFFAPQISTILPDGSSSVGDAVDKVGAALGSLSSLGSSDSKSKAAPPTFSVSYVYKNQKFASNKVMTVDYRERHAVIKTHNPQGLLWLFGLQLGDSFEDYVTPAEIGDNMTVRKSHVSIDPELFGSTGLHYAEVAVWKKNAGIDPEKGDSEFASPDSVSPLVATLTKEQPEADIVWRRDNGEGFGYYYQVRFGYGDRDIVSEPVVSYSQNLIIIPELCIFSKPLHVASSGIDFNIVKNVSVRLDISDPAGTRTPVFIHLDESHQEETQMVRGRYRDQTDIQLMTAYDLKDGPTLSTEASVFGMEVPVFNPLRSRKLTLIFANATEQVSTVIIDTTVSSSTFKGELKKRTAVSDFTIPVVQIPVEVMDEGDQIAYEMYLVTKNGELVQLPSGISDGSPISVGLSSATYGQLTLVWDGPSPKKLSLKEVRVYLSDENGEMEKPFVFKGDVPPDPIETGIDSDSVVSARLVKCYLNGSKKKENDLVIKDRKIIIRCS